MTPPRRRRTIRDDERVLWAKVTQDVDRIYKRPDGPTAREPFAAPAHETMVPPTKPSPASVPTSEPAHLNPSSTRARVARPSGPVTKPETVPAPSYHLDRKTQQNLKRKRVGIEARLDLHGHSQHDAHLAVDRFITRAASQNKRYVLIITGKGRMSETPGGVLRRMVPMWLTRPPLAHHIVGFDWAGPRDGGDGALYVHLRRSKD